MELHWLLLFSIFLVALLYASVGLGGASGYLAILSLWGIPIHQMAASALILNLLVSGIALVNFAKARHFSWRRAWLFILASIPAAWIGGWLQISPILYHWLLGSVLVVAAWRIWVELPAVSTAGFPKPAVAIPVGAGVGVISGIVGIGGGIFLSPLLILKRWADSKQAAGVSACFILANSAAGLLGRMAREPLAAGPLLWFLFAAGFGGAIGSNWGANHFSGLTLRRILAAVLVFAALKAVGR